MMTIDDNKYYSLEDTMDITMAQHNDELYKINADFNG